MEIKDSGRPVHRDATARIRPRVFLEGGFLVELQPGSPSAPELADDGTIPLAQTTVPVQFHQVLGVLDAPAREQPAAAASTPSPAASATAARTGLKTLAPRAQAAAARHRAGSPRPRGAREPDDVSGWSRRPTRSPLALDQRPERLGSLVDNLATTAAAVRSRDSAAGGVAGRARAACCARPRRRCARSDRALPALERAGGHVAPALPIAPRAFRDTAAAHARAGPAGRAAAARADARWRWRPRSATCPSLVGRLARRSPRPSR